MYMVPVYLENAINKYYVHEKVIYTVRRFIAYVATMRSLLDER